MCIFIQYFRKRWICEKPTGVKDSCSPSESQVNAVHWDTIKGSFPKAFGVNVGKSNKGFGIKFAIIKSTKKKDRFTNAGMKNQEQTQR